MLIGTFADIEVIACRKRQPVASCSLQLDASDKGIAT
jgi:hypothetical protein